MTGRLETLLRRVPAPTRRSIADRLERAVRRLDPGRTYVTQDARGGIVLHVHGLSLARITPGNVSTARPSFGGRYEPPSSAHRPSLAERYRTLPPADPFAVDVTPHKAADDDLPTYDHQTYFGLVSAPPLDLSSPWLKPSPAPEPLDPFVLLDDDEPGHIDPAKHYDGWSPTR